MKKRIIVGSMLLALVALLTACSTNSTKPKGGKLLNSYKYIVGGEVYTYDNDQKVFLDKVSYTIDKMTFINEHFGKATVTVTAPNVEAIMQEAIREAVQENPVENSSSVSAENSDHYVRFQDLPDPKKANENYNKTLELVNKKFNEKIKSGKQMINTTFEMDMQNLDGSWKLVPNQAWANAVTGNASNLLQDSFKKLLEGN